MYNTANNAFGKLEASIGPSATSFIMQSQYSDLFPEFLGKKYFIKLEQRDDLNSVIKREIVKVTNKAGDLFTIERGAGFCPASDTATEQTNISFSFNAGDSVSLTIVSEHIQDMETRIAEKAQDDEVVKLTGDQTISDVKTFSVSPQVPEGVNPNDAVNKGQLDSEITAASSAVALYDRDTYILGEDCDENDSLFAETSPTFAESTLVQNIGDVTANTRVALYGFGSGVAGNTMQLALRKYVSPSADLSIRLETISGGNPTGTLVDANATATVTEASLTTSLADTTITFAGSFTIPKGQKFAIVLSQVGDVVNGTNYYGVGYVARDTTTRGMKNRDGSFWNNTPIPSGINVNSDFSWEDNAGVTQTTRQGAKITMTEDMYLTEVTKDPVTTDTIAYLTDSARNVIAQSNYVGNTATFPQLLLSSGVTYYILSDKGGASRNYRLDTGRTFPISYTGFNLIGGFYSGSDSASQLPIITSITTQEEVGSNGGFIVNVFPYTQSTITLPTILSKTSATYPYKLPTDFPRFATESKSAGEEVVCAYYGLKDGFDGLSPVTYYASNTPGLISSTHGTNVYEIGKAISSDTIDIGNILLFNSIAGTTYLVGESGGDAILNFTPTAVWTKLKEIQINIGGGYTTEFEVRFTVGSNDNRAAIFVNGAQVGTNRSGPSLNTRSAVFSESFTVPDGALIQIYAQKTSSGTTEVRNFRVKNSLTPKNDPIFLGKTNL